MPEYVYHDGLYSASPLTIKLFRILTILLLALVIVANWRSFALISRALAVILLTDILITPPMIRRREQRTGKTVQSSVIMLNSYRWVMTMAILLFPMLRTH
jgi:hypothetical protein